MAFGMKDDQNTPINDINTITNPVTKTMIDRYVWASNFCKDKVVLDCATGHCYGGVILKAMGAFKVHMGDIDNTALDNAKERYGTDGLAYIHDCDVTQEWGEMPSYDVVVSIETFEHVPKETVQTMLKNFKQVCKSGGTIIITTPQRRTPEFIYQEGSTHLYEYSINEFVNEISKVFDEFDIYGGLEFRHPASNELNTVFTTNPQYINQSNVMIAVIKNNKSE